MQHASTSSDLMYRLLIQGVQEYAIYLLGADGQVLSWNAGAERAKGYMADEIVGKNFALFYSQADREAGVPARNLHIALTAGSFSTEGWQLRKDGSRFWADVVINPVHDDAGRFIGFAKITRDLTARRESEQRLLHIASHDALTGLLNRAAFNAALDDRMPRLSQGGALAVHFIDLDRFKPVNDAFGHEAGDILLQQVATRLRNVLGAHDIVARLGGDEFAVVQLPAPDRPSCTALAQETVSALAQPFGVGGATVRIGASVGIAWAPEHGSTAAELLQAADLALYEAKERGRGRWHFYGEALSERVTTKRVLELRLRHAVGTNGFTLFYQPIVDAQSSRTVGYEALIRWKDARNNLISPADFIPMAGELGLMPVIGAWVQHTACRQAAAWPETITVSVNIAATELRSGRLVETVRRALERSGLAPGRLELELTETAILTDRRQAAEILQALRDVGVKVALDDFGTGYSSLSLVQEFPLTRLKIDGSFVRQFDGSRRFTAVVRAIAILCKEFGLALTAEGVETEAQRRILIKEGCDSLQGYLLGRPQPWAEPAPLRRDGG